MPRPETFTYKEGNYTFEHRWGPGPAAAFKKAESAGWRINPAEYLGPDTPTLIFSTRKNPALQPLWQKLCRFLGLDPTIMPVSARVVVNAAALPVEGDGVAHLAFLGREGSRWSPVIDMAAWSDGRLWFRRTAYFHDFDNVRPLLAFQLHSELDRRWKAWELVWQRQ